jgi:hypothetical protein
MGNGSKNKPSTYLEIKDGLILYDDLNFMQLLDSIFSKPKATFTKAINAGTSTNGPITPAKACPLLMPNTPMATAM